MREHIKIVHEEKKLYKCDTCGKSFKQAAHMKEHIGMVHLGINLYKCDSCSKSFYKKSQLDRHLIGHKGHK